MRFGQWKKKDRWLFLLTLGVILCILAFPVEKIFGGDKETQPQVLSGAWGSAAEESGEAAEAAEAGSKAAETVLAASGYEQMLEARVRELLSHVEGVGNVDVMIVLSSSTEKIWQTDENSSSSAVEELQSGNVSHRQSEESSEVQTVRLNEGNGEAAMLKKELYPQISGIVISADGGQSPTVQREISSAMEALFGLPAHKIKVLKRVE